MVTTGGERLSRRERWTVALLAGPAVAVALGLCAIEAWRVLHPRSPMFFSPFAYSLADAIETGNVPRAYAYIRAGQDPNQLIAVRHRVLTRNRWVLTSPALWSVATGHTSVLQMLLGYGARLERPADRRALCLAETLGHTEIARILRIHGGTPPAACGELTGDDAPLLRVLSIAERD